MAKTRVKSPGFGKLTRILDRIAKADPQPLMMKYRRILEEDNKYGVLNQIAGDDSPIAPVTYRPDRKKKAITWSKGRQRGMKKKSAYTGMFEESAYNNLSHQQYRLLSGPALAPRGLSSRLITNYRTAHGHSGKRWFAVGAWFDIVSGKGKPFMLGHFTGSGRNKRRDHRGLRTEGRRRIKEETHKWVMKLIG